MLLLLFVTFLTFLGAKTPVLLIPAIGGSQVQARNYDWESWGYLWLNSARLLPLLKDGYIKDLSVVYSPRDDSYGSNVKQTRPYSFGTVDGIDHIDDLLVSDTYYYHNLIQALKDAGYNNGDLIGAPFDFRVTSYRNAPNSYFPELQKLIETTVNANGGQPLLAVSHSGGSTVFRQFLANYVTAEWKQQYIKGWVTGNGVFAGGPLALEVLISYKEFTDLISGQDINSMGSFWAGLYWLLPTKFGFSEDTVVVNVTLTDADSFVVTVGNITEAFSRGIGGDHTTAAQNTLNNINAEFASPEVEVWLYYGTGQDTVISNEFTGSSSSWWKQSGTDIFTDGDGILPTVSALAPTQWNTNYPLHIIEKPGESHIGLVSNTDFINDIIALALNTKEHEVFSPDGLYAKRRQYVQDIIAVAKDLQHAFALRVKAIRENIKKIAAESLRESQLLEQVEQLGAKAQTALLRTILPMNQAISNAEQDLRMVVVDLLEHYGTTQNLTARGGSFARPEEDTEAAAEAARVALTERDNKFVVKAASYKQRIIGQIQKSMKKATDIVDEMEKRIEALLTTSP